MNIGDNIEYENEYGLKVKGSIVDIHSDMDSYEDMRLKDGVPLYYSKKLKKFVPVKPKNMNSVFIEVFIGKNVINDFISLSDVA